MKYGLVICLIAFFVCSQEIALAQRHLDLKIRVIRPKTGDSVNSPQTYTTVYSIKNLGPDSIRSTDYYKLRIQYGNVPFPLYTYSFGKNLGGQDSIINSINLKMNFDATNWNVPFCITLKEYRSINKIIDTIVKPTKPELFNDTSCSYVTHISYLGVEENEFEKACAIYPVPSNGEINVRFKTSVSGIARVYNNLGQELMNLSFEDKKFIKFNKKDELDGPLLLNIIIDNQVINKWIVIQK